jgi:chromosome partitioning protein
MSKIIAFGNQKGGVGKTTCTVLVANSLSQSPFNLNIIVIDIDKQKSLSTARELDLDYYEKPAPYKILSLDIETFEREIRNLDKTNDIILIDTGGRLDKDNLSQELILAYCDFLFIPFVSGNYNLDSSLDYLKFVLGIQSRRSSSSRKLNIIGFINKYRARSKARRQLSEEIEDLKKVANIDFMRNNLNDYSLFSEIDTYENIYNENASPIREKASLNFSVWLSELFRVITNKQ